MPLIQHSTFPGSPKLQFNGHLQTIVPGLFRKVPGVAFVRERIATPDGDFLDLDWLKNQNARLLILTHGLEGSSDRQYILGAAKLFSKNGWDVLAWNCRSCSGEMNHAFRMYHHGDVEDIGTVVNHALRQGQYRQIGMMGFSMGANITMNFLGKMGQHVPPEICAAVVFSAPCDLEAGANVLDRPDNLIYKKRFLKALAEKVEHKNQQFPGRLDVSKLKKVRRWRDFDEWFAAPICGFRSADEFYKNASSKYFIPDIRVPTLLVSALNDPILTPECFPVEIARKHPNFHLELPKSGGHCGFMTSANREFSWAETRGLAFVELHAK